METIVYNNKNYLVKNCFAGYDSNYDESCYIYELHSNGLVYIAYANDKALGTGDESDNVGDIYRIVDLGHDDDASDYLV
jgi:hypothetical protein